MDTDMASFGLVGATGAVGSRILSNLLFIPSITLALPSITKISAIACRPLKFLESAKLQPIIEDDPSRWPQKILEINPTPSIMITAIGSSKPGAKPTFERRKKDIGLKIELARAAKQAGVKVFVLVSPSAPDASTHLASHRMKGELKNAIRELDFEHAVLLMPGLIVGLRDEVRAGQAVAGSIANFLGHVSRGFLKNRWAQDADVVARAAVIAGLKCLEGSVKDEMWEISHSDIIRLGQTEWRERYSSYWPETEVCHRDSEDDPFFLEQTLEHLKHIELPDTEATDVFQPIRLNRYGLPCIKEGEKLNYYCVTA